MTSPLEVPSTGQKRSSSSKLLSPTKRARSTSTASASSVDTDHSAHSDASVIGGVRIDLFRPAESDDLAVAEMRRRFMEGMQWTNKCDRDKCGHGPALTSCVEQSIMAGAPPKIVLTKSSDDPLESAQSPFDAVLQRTLARLDRPQGSETSAEALYNKRCTLHKAYCQSRSSMWSAADRCGAAIEAANSLVAPLDKSVTWTAEDSRRLVATLEAQGKMQPIRAAGTELISARQAYKAAALSTLSLAYDIFLAGHDMTVTDALLRQTILDHDQEKLTQEALEMSRNRNLDHVRSLTREMREISALYNTRSKPFIERYGPLSSWSADPTNSDSGDGGSKTVVPET